MSCCSTFCVYFILILNFLYDFNILFCSCISTRNIKLLKSYQKFYITLWIMIFLFHTLWYLSKIFMILCKKLKYNFASKIDLILIISGIFIFVIAITYDITLICKKEIKFIGYQTFLWLGFIIYLILSLLEHNQIEEECILSNDISKEQMEKLEEKINKQGSLDDDSIPLKGKLD